jgi:hypothetical protein
MRKDRRRWIGEVALCGPEEKGRPKPTRGLLRGDEGKTLGLTHKPRPVVEPRSACRQGPHRCLGLDEKFETTRPSLGCMRGP